MTGDPTPHVAELTHFLVDAAQMHVVRDVRDRCIDPANLRRNGD